MSQPVRFCILGDLRIEAGDRTVDATRPAVRNVLVALLLAAGEALSIHRLSELAWGPHGCSRGTLHTTVSRLRGWLKQQIGEAAVVTADSSGYCLRLVRAETDLLEYQRLLRRVKPGDPDGRAEALRQALTLWRGPVFANGPSWLRSDPQVRQLEESRVGLALELAELASQLGVPEMPVGPLEQLAAESPYEERVHAALFESLRACGRRAEALRRYETVRRRLAEELGISPGIALAGVHAALLQDADSSGVVPIQPIGIGTGHTAVLSQAPAAVKIATAKRGTPRPRVTRQRHRLVMGSFEAQLALPHVRSMLAQVRILHPELAVEIRHLDFVEQVTAVRQGTVDVCLCYLPTAPDLRFAPLAVEPRVLCVSSTDPLAARSQITLADVAQHTVVSISPRVHQQWRDFWTVNPRPGGVPVRYTNDEISNVEALFSAITLSNAVAFVPSACRQLYPRPGISYVDITDLSPCTAALTWQPGRANPAVRTFVETARAAASSS